MTDDRIVQNLQKNGLCSLVIREGDAEFDALRTPFYGSLARTPAVIVKAANDADVARTISVACEYKLELAIRSGGHGIAGHSTSEGGIVLDLSAMRKVEIDPVDRTAWAEAGATAGVFTAAAAAYGLAVGFGDTASVGIGGITLGGGVGFLSRKYGLTIDSLLGADIVTADGRLLRVDAESYPDLFWGIRGGGGNFGVVTRFRFRLHPVDRVLGGMMILPAEPEVIERLAAALEASPEELSAIINIIAPAPPMPFLPKEHHGRPLVMAMMVYAGDIEDGQRALVPVRKVAGPIVDMVRPIRYPEIYGVEGPHPAALFARSMYAECVDGNAAESIVEYLRTSPASMEGVQIRVLGGAVARVPSDATAYAHRDCGIMVNVAAMYERREETAVHRDRVIGLADVLRRKDRGAYVNFLMDEGPERVRQAYPGPTWDRLRQIKGHYDPDNVFRQNQNIPPAC